MNRQAFRELHERHRNRLLYSMVSVVKNREEAEDITSAAFTRAFENWDSFRGESPLYTWVHAIALNEARRSLQQKRAVSLDALDGRGPKALVEPDRPAHTLERSECRRQLRKALRRIPALYRRALVDHFVGGYSVKRIAGWHGGPVGTVVSRMFTAKRILCHAWEA